ncbi:hypothetical protein AAG747_21255 [Rapidithrix thailandica]|uniref:Uncharacterized protein n=1 Tax=Rapidithrix thailandica TaxID=413964 RepID=A0AAW9SIF5_9BACT
MLLDLIYFLITNHLYYKRFYKDQKFIQAKITDKTENTDVEGPPYYRIKYLFKMGPEMYEGEADGDKEHRIGSNVQIQVSAKFPMESHLSAPETSEAFQ